MKSIMLAGALAFAASPALAWDLPADNATMPASAIQRIIAANDYPQTSTYKQKIDFIDFVANGVKFTQVVITLTPDKPRMRNGKKLVVVGAEPGSEYGMDFVTTVEGKEGPAVWLAKRGFTFVALTRVGRWNFLAPAKDGSWATIPIEKRMPIFSRAQKAPWPDSASEVKRAGAEAGSSAAISGTYRYPKAGTELEKQILAATPAVYIQGYKLALDKEVTDRAHSNVLFWGMSTGGASLYPLAKDYTPDGFLCWGTSSTGLAYVQQKAERGDYRDLYDHSATRVRMRGIDDFNLYTKHVDAATKAKWWQAALKSPRFKSTEDESMQFGAAALTEHALRLWNAKWFPAADKRKGLAAFIKDMFEPSYPPAELKKVPVLVLNGTADEAQPPNVVDSTRRTMEMYTKKYRVGRFEGMHHYIFTQDNVKVVGSLWMRYIDSGFFD